MGGELTLALVCQQFWISRGKSFVRRIINECFLCKRRRVKPTVPAMASLPGNGFALCDPPFADTSVDYFGAISVKRGRVTEVSGDVSSHTLLPVRST